MSSRVLLVLPLVAAGMIYASVASALDLHSGIEAYFYAPAKSASADLVCKATVPADPEHVTYALARAMRLYEVLEYTPPEGYGRRDLARAMQCLWQVSEKASPRGMVLGATFAKTPEDRNMRMRQSAERGDPEGMWRYAIANAVPEQRQIYLEWSRKAAVLGHPSAQYRMAASLDLDANELQHKSPEQVERIETLRREAFQWYEVFSLNTNPHGVSCDETIYSKFFFRGVERCSGGYFRGLVKAHVAEHYFRGGNGTAQDYGRAAMWFRAAIADGVYQNGELFAAMLERGLGVPRDPELAQEIRLKTEQFRQQRIRQSTD